MNQAELHRKLIAAARRNPPSERVPHAFEKRILARLRACPMVDHWALWSQALWRAVAPCAAIMLLLGAWWWFTPAGAPPANDLSQDLENTMLAAAESEQSLDFSR
ncbi:MAG: hypothetical protein ABSH34_09985 [Verrucomicrobiota bacterium]|jgi:hypothetical protein